MSTLRLDSVVCAAKTQVGTSVGDEVMILNLEDGVYYGLDPVGARIWELLMEPTTVLAIREILVSEFEVEPEQCEDDLFSLLRALIEVRLVDVSPGEAA